MANEKTIDFEEGNEAQQKTQGVEFDIDSFSDVAVGDSKKYNRPNLDKKTVKILSAKVTAATEDEPAIVAVGNSSVKYKKTRFVVTFDSKNEDAMHDREFYSGCIQFIQKDGTLSEPKFYRTGGESQVANLWKLVAKHKDVDPNELSPRTFMSFLNSGIKVKLKSEDIKFNGKTTKKNIISEILG